MVGIVGVKEGLEGNVVFVEYVVVDIVLCVVVVIFVLGVEIGVIVYLID